MFNEIYNLSLKYFSRHPILNSLAHSAGGFGLALLIQQVLKGDAFLPPMISLIFIAFSAVVHIVSFIKK